MSNSKLNFNDETSTKRLYFSVEKKTLSSLHAKEKKLKSDADKITEKPQYLILTKPIVPPDELGRLSKA